VLNMLPWLEKDELVNPHTKLRFEAAVGQAVSLFGRDIEGLKNKLSTEFGEYLKALVNTPESGDKAKGRGKKTK
jgi:hypothetical protein